MKAAKATVLLLAVVVAAAAALSPPDAVDHQPAAAGGIAGTLRGGGHHHRDDGRHRSSDDQTSLLSTKPAAADGGVTGNLRGHYNRGSDDGRPPPLTALTECLGICMTSMSTCWMERCTNPPLRDPISLPLCFLSCTNDGMVCSTGCAAKFNGIAGTLRGGGPHNRGDDDNGHHYRSSDDGQNSDPLTKLALCVSTCGSNVASCIMTKCYEPLARGKGNPMMVPICLLGCTTEVMNCATSCPNNIVV